MDRFVDLHVMDAMQVAVASKIGQASMNSEDGLALAKQRLERAYAWFDGELSGRMWAAGNDFTLADCAGAPSLFYAHWVHEMPEKWWCSAPTARVLAQPSFARAVDEARHFRPNFPLSAPDRD